MIELRLQLYLAALLHDIGKFWQRADLSLEKSAISKQSKELAHMICPVSKNGGYTHQHVVWTHEFLNGHFGSGWSEMIKMASYHHRPATELQKIIQLADSWSAGIDRYQDPNAEESSGISFKELRMISVFDELRVGNTAENEKKLQFDLKPLSLGNDCIFPSDTLTGSYSEHWSDFANEFKSLGTVESSWEFAHTLYYQLRKYLWCVPSSGWAKEIQDVSLFDHSKTTAALSLCLFDYFTAHYTDIVNNSSFILSEALRTHSTPVIMLCGDLSGIQKFIYSISGTHASKSLKGRSFYLQLLLDAVIQRISRECGATAAHVIYASGGKFFMLLPNTVQVESKLKIIENDVIEMLHREHGGELYLCMGYTAFGMRKKSNGNQLEVVCESGAEFDTDTSLSKLWREVLGRAAVKKQQKFQSLFTSRFSHFFAPAGDGGIHGLCAVTGREFESPDERFDIGKSENVYVCRPVKAQIDLGKQLKSFDHLIMHSESEPNKALRNLFEFAPSDLGVYYYLSDNESVLSLDASILYSINTTDAVSGVKGRRLGTGFMFYGGNRQAMNETGEEPALYEDLAGSSNAAFRRLGVLRMDVDGLGAIFTSGIPETRRNLAMYSQLSNLLDLFFSGYLNTLRDSESYRDYVNIIYSGGDDVFALGRWDKVIDFAADVRNAFRKFVCSREEISISAGLVMVDPKFPIAKAAQLAGEAEDKAKHYRSAPEKILTGKVPEKNAICLFGQAVSWDIEFPLLRDMAQQMATEVDSNILSRGILQKIHQFRLVRMQNRNDWRWLAAYTFARIQKTGDKESKVLAQLAPAFISGHYQAGDGTVYTLPTERILDIADMAARWAEYKLRSND